MAGGISNLSPAIGSNANMLMTSLRQLIAANPEYLKSGIPTHLIQQMWKKEEVPTVNDQSSQVRANIKNGISGFQGSQMEEDEGDDEEMGVAETYADYWPAKCKLFEPHLS